MFASKVTEKNEDSKNLNTECELSEAQKEQLLAKIDLSGISKRTPEDQLEGKKLSKELASVFLQHDLDLSKKSLVKHKIKLMDETPFKECYSISLLECVKIKS